MTRKEREQLEKEQRFLRYRVLIGTRTQYADKARLEDIAKLLRGESLDKQEELG